MACSGFDLICPSLRHRFWEQKWFKKGGGVPLWSGWRYRDSDWAKLTIPHFGVPTGKDTGKFWQWHKRDLPKAFYCKEVTAMNGDRAWMRSLKVMCMPCYWPLWAQHGRQAGWQSFFFPRRCSSFKEARESSKLHQLRPPASPLLFPCGEPGSLESRWQCMGLLQKETSQIVYTALAFLASFRCLRNDLCCFAWWDIHQDLFIVSLGDEYTMFLLSGCPFRKDNISLSNFCWDTVKEFLCLSGATLAFEKCLIYAFEAFWDKWPSLFHAWLLVLGL